MNGFEQLKEEIANMSVDDFIKNFVSGQGIRDYICGGINVKSAECCNNENYVCLRCIRNHLESEVVK